LTGERDDIKPKRTTFFRSNGRKGDNIKILNKKKGTILGVMTGQVLTLSKMTGQRESKMSSERRRG